MQVLKPTAVRAVVNSSVTALGKPMSSSTPTKLSATPNNSSPSSGLNHVTTGNFAAVAAANNNANNSANNNTKSTCKSHNATLYVESQFSIGVFSVQRLQEEIHVCVSALFLCLRYRF